MEAGFLLAVARRLQRPHGPAHVGAAQMVGREACVIGFRGLGRQARQLHLVKSSLSAVFPPRPGAALPAQDTVNSAELPMPHVQVSHEY